MLEGNRDYNEIISFLGDTAMDLNLLAKNQDSISLELKLIFIEVHEYKTNPYIFFLTLLGGGSRP